MTPTQRPGQAVGDPAPLLRMPGTPELQVGERVAHPAAGGPRVRFGNHTAVRANLSDREAIRRFYVDVLGCRVQRLGRRKDDFCLGYDFFVAFLYDDADGALAAAGFQQAVFLELATDDEPAVRFRILDFGVTVVRVPDPHLYFQAPGGQVFRLVGIDEDLSRYEGTDYGEQNADHAFTSSAVGATP